MWKRVRSRITSAHVLAALALFVALGGTGYAAAKLNGKRVKKGTLPGSALKKRTITASKIKRNTLGGTEINESKLGIVPSATAALRAGNADTVGGVSPGALKVKCPSGTDPVGGACIERAQRAATTYNEASIACGARGLPNVSQLVSFASSHPGQTGTEWTYDILDLTPNQEIAVVDISTGLASESANSPHPYRCVTTPVN